MTKRINADRDRILKPRLQKNPGLLIQVVASVTVACPILFGRILFWELTTVHIVIATTVIVVIIGLIEFATAWFLLIIRPDIHTKIVATSLGERIQAVIAIVVLGLLLPASVVLTFNERLDGSRPTEQVLIVHEKWIRKYKGGSPVCMASVTPSVRHWLPFPALYSNEAYVALPCDRWLSIEPERSALTLKLHPGLFGLPWYDPTVNVVP